LGSLQGKEIDWRGEEKAEANTAKLRKALLRLEDAGARLWLERDCATDGLGGAVDFFADPYLRCRVDAVLFREGKPPLIIDWKTGRRGADDVQLAISALCVAASSRGPGPYELSYVYVDTGATELYRLEVDVEKVKGLEPELRSRSSLASTLEKIAALEEAESRGDFPRNPGRHCDWCGECPKEAK
jgi:hypothetical protein